MNLKKQGDSKHSMALVLVELHGLKFVNDSLGTLRRRYVINKGCSKIK